MKPRSKRLVYHNKYGIHLIMGTTSTKPEELSFFERGKDGVVCFKLVGETERAYWYQEFDPTIVKPEPTTTVVAPVAEGI